MHIYLYHIDVGRPVPRLEIRPRTMRATYLPIFLPTTGLVQTADVRGGLARAIYDVFDTVTLD